MHVWYLNLQVQMSENVLSAANMQIVPLDLKALAALRVAKGSTLRREA
jgi:hypothetical protein